MARIASTVADLIGGTPLVRINHVVGDGVDVVAKVESFNPASSVKDRIARSIIDAAEASGALAPGGTIVEATSGNTGIALSMVGAARGYKVVIVMPASMSVERRAIVRAFGAEVVLTDPKGGVSRRSRRGRAHRLRASGRDHRLPVHKPREPRRAHRPHGRGDLGGHRGPGRRVRRRRGHRRHHLGRARVLKDKNPNVRIVAVQPAESPLLTGGAPGPHGIQGLHAPTSCPTPSTPISIDEVVSVETATALEFARRAPPRTGLLVGISSGAALAGTAVVAARPELAGKKIVTLLPDTGERYLSTALFAGLED